MAVYARGSGKTFSIGQIVRVRLLEVTPLQGGLLLEMISDPLPAPAGRKAARQAITRERGAPRGRSGGGGGAGRSSGGGPPRRGKPNFDTRTRPKGSKGKGKRR